MNKRNILIALGGLILVSILIYIGKNRSRGELEVNVGKVENRTIISTVSANGKIRPEAEVKISADVSGEITELYIEEGDTVKEGQLLLKINPDLYLTSRDRARAGVSSSQSNLKTSQAQLTQAQARLTEQEAAYARNKQLYTDKVLSQAEYDVAKSAYAIAQSEVKAAQERISAARFGIQNSQATLTEANKTLGRTSIYAPSNGVVSALNNEKGERVVGTAQMAGTEIMVISNFNNMEVIVDVNENDILQVKKGDTSLVEVDAYSDRKFKGIVTEISKSANSSGVQMSTDQVTNFEVKVRLLKSSYVDLLEVSTAPFLPGMSANVEIQTLVKDNIPCLPIEAVGTRVQEDSANISTEEELDEVVFSISKSKAVLNIVKTGIQDSRYIEIREGLKVGDKVIVGPYDAVSKKLDNDQKIKITEKKVMNKLEAEEE
ncbi:efflux RND transporter periplasmic adaptor subunit [Bacteroidia bacterium]|jgi:HlyD family secretion protein|nr:efflux RND transporter periplasmic adaptor subunit [Bacteroidia bacterium]MDC1430905.1 efflux RND transporter periplasmic adaptor subunit [Bacteroidia bacterium]